MNKMYFLKTFTTFSLNIGYKVCTHQCECMGTKNSFITEDQEYQNLHIALPEMSVYVTFYFYHWVKLENCNTCISHHNYI